MSSTDTNTQATVVILGGTGEIGYYATKIFLKEYHASFPSVRITTRNTQSAKAQELEALGAELRSSSQPLDELIGGADVVVDALGGAAVPIEYRRELAQALVKNNVKVYFLSEYGIDYRLNTFTGFDHPEWASKTVLDAEIRTIVQDKVKVIGLMVGMFLGYIFYPGLGLDAEKNVYSPLGPLDRRFAVTAEPDIARSIARLAILSLDRSTASNVPAIVRIAGQNVTYEDVRDAVSRHKGIPKGEIKGEDLAAFKKSLSESKTLPGILDYIRVAIGEGTVDHTKNDNELVNPNESLWKWKTVTDDLYTGSQL